MDPEITLVSSLPERDPPQRPQSVVAPEDRILPASARTYLRAMPRSGFAYARPPTVPLTSGLDAPPPIGDGDSQPAPALVVFLPGVPIEHADLDTATGRGTPEPSYLHPATGNDASGLHAVNSLREEPSILCGELTLSRLLLMIFLAAALVFMLFLTENYILHRDEG